MLISNCSEENGQGSKARWLSSGQTPMCLCVHSHDQAGPLAAICRPAGDLYYNILVVAVMEAGHWTHQLVVSGRALHELITLHSISCWGFYKKEVITAFDNVKGKLHFNCLNYTCAWEGGFYFLNSFCVIDQCNIVLLFINNLFLFHLHSFILP